jgi:cytochrome c5
MDYALRASLRARVRSCHVTRKHEDTMKIFLSALGVVVAVSLGAAAGQDGPRPERGEQIVNAACTKCHDLRPIETQALDEAGWSKVVKAKIEQGAEVKAEDVPVLVAFLVKRHGPLPDGPGKDILLNICTRCHDLQRIRRERTSAEGWLEILEAMLNEGAPLPEKDLPELLRYLARNFGPPRF